MLEAIAPPHEDWSILPLPGFTPVHFLYLHKDAYMERVLGRLSADPGLRIAVDTVVCGLRLSDAGDRVARVLCHSKALGHFSLAVGDVVLATGGIENARLLLELEHSLPGKLHKCIPGERFMDHPQGICGLLVPQVPYAPGMQRCLALEADRAGQMVRWMFELEAATAQAKGLPGIGFNLWPTEPEWLPDELSNIACALSGDGSPAKPNESRSALTAISFMSEQMPNPSSAVTLGNETDKLGRRCAKIDWRLEATDLQAVLGGIQLFRDAMKKTGQGKVYLPGFTENPEKEFLAMHWSGSAVPLAGSHHHMGTTRMHHDPSRGVVDANCRHHQLSNLYVAGSSVFTTGSYINPTLTIMALGRRLGQYLAGSRQFSSGGV
ncbi:GMC oxidoreductase [Halovulum sp. GXIMD14794]